MRSLDASLVEDLEEDIINIIDIEDTKTVLDDKVDIYLVIVFAFGLLIIKYIDKYNFYIYRLILTMFMIYIILKQKKS
jgi:hypothetical protein